VEVTCDPIDWKSASSEHLNIRLPFELERFVHIMPGNIVAVAGSPNAGKTAFLLNVIHLNQQDFDIQYFSSEMGPSELRSRLERFDPIRRIEDWRFHPWERSSNFADVIRPGRGVINIIDFLELHADFWRIGGMLKSIHDRLNGAVAIIALQKNQGSEAGLGGSRGLEKPRLYLAMEPGRCRITKGKNWASSQNPNGLEVEFKLIQGCHFHVVTDWRETGNNRR
jgi:hypothetical protein